MPWVNYKRRATQRGSSGACVANASHQQNYSYGFQSSCRRLKKLIKNYKHIFIQKKKKNYAFLFFFLVYFIFPMFIHNRLAQNNLKQFFGILMTLSTSISYSFFITFVQRKHFPDTLLTRFLYIYFRLEPTA